jgi:putative endonuclease
VERVRRSSQSVDGLKRVKMWYVYILRSVTSPTEEYTGMTADLKQRIADHNSGKSKHTSKFMPWKLLFYSAFPNKITALDFEKYLKSHLGRAFAKKRLIKAKEDNS